MTPSDLLSSDQIKRVGLTTLNCAACRTRAAFSGWMVTPAGVEVGNIAGVGERGAVGVGAVVAVGGAIVAVGASVGVDVLQAASQVEKIIKSANG